MSERSKGTSSWKSGCGLPATAHSSCNTWSVTHLTISRYGQGNSALKRKVWASERSSMMLLTSSRSRCIRSVWEGWWILRMMFWMMSSLTSSASHRSLWISYRMRSSSPLRVLLKSRYNGSTMPSPGKPRMKKSYLIMIGKGKDARVCFKNGSSKQEAARKILYLQTSKNVRLALP